MAARMPAQPAPTTRTSCFASTSGDGTAGVSDRASLRRPQVVANRTGRLDPEGPPLEEDECKWTDGQERDRLAETSVDASHLDERRQQAYDTGGHENADREVARAYADQKPASPSRNV